MTKRIALLALLASTLVIAAGYASVFLPGATPAWAPWTIALGTPAAMVAMMVIGAARDGGIGRLVYPFAFVFIVIAGGFAAALVLPPADPADPALWLGLPRRAAIILYGIGLLPLFVVPVAYAWTFDELTLSDEDWQRVREAAAARTAGSEADEVATTATTVGAEAAGRSEERRGRHAGASGGGGSPGGAERRERGGGGPRTLPHRSRADTRRRGATMGDPPPERPAAKARPR